MNTDKIYAESIANEYAPKGTSKVIALRKLDRKAKLPASIFTYTFGISGALIFGLGMCLSLQVIGVSTPAGTVLGIVLGVIGILLMALNYPLYRRILSSSKEKYAFDIIELAREISES